VGISRSSIVPPAAFQRLRSVGMRDGASIVSHDECLFADSTVLARAVLAGLSAQDEGSLRPGKAGDAEIIKKVPFPQPQCWPCTKEMPDTRAWTCRESLYPAKHHVFDTTS
jgi:hypothetical protein